MLTPTNEESRFKLPLASEEKKKECFTSRNNEFCDMKMMNTLDAFGTKDA